MKEYWKYKNTKTCEGCKANAIIDNSCLLGFKRKSKEGIYISYEVPTEPCLKPLTFLELSYYMENKHRILKE